MRTDLALPGFSELIKTETATFPGYGTHPLFGIANENRLLGNYAGAIGGKTGFTTDAGNTYAGVAERNGHTLVVTMLAGSQHPRRQWMQAASLLEWGFAVVDAGLDPVGRLVDPAADPIEASPAASSSNATSSSNSASSSKCGILQQCGGHPRSGCVEPGCVELRCVEPRCVEPRCVERCSLPR